MSKKSAGLEFFVFEQLLLQKNIIPNKLIYKLYLLRGSLGFAKPDSVLFHFGALLGGCEAAAGGEFFRVRLRAPADFDAIVRVVRHFKLRLALQDFSDRKLPFAAVRTGVANAVFPSSLGVALLDFGADRFRVFIPEHEQFRMAHDFFR